jgi:sugar transferase (PEP-CTERM/EpsH1 system associated)
MKILFIVPYVPSRIRVRPYEFIRWLGKLGHSVTVATIWTSPAEYVELGEVQKICSHLLAVRLPKWKSILNAALAIPQKIPLQSLYSFHPQFAKKLSGITNNHTSATKFDLVHVEHLRGVQYGLKIQKQGNIPVVWDSVDCISHLFRQSAVANPKPISKWINQLELPRTEAYERKLVNQFPRVLVTSSIDRFALLDLLHGEDQYPSIEVIPNGVDLEYFQPEPSKRQDHTIVVSGKMSYHANIHMVLELIREIMPLVWEKRPEVKVWVVGKDPPTILQQLAHDPRIIVTGTVSDIRPYLQQASVAVAPLGYGAGIQNKVLEAMACATPVVCSPLAVSAIHVNHGRNILIANNKSDFANHIIQLLDNPEQAAAIGKAGRDYVESNHHWQRIVKRLETIYTEVIAEREKSRL